MAALISAHTDPDAVKAQEGLDRTVVVLTDKSNSIPSSVLQVRFLDHMVDYILGINPEAIATGATTLGATTPVGPAALGTGAGSPVLTATAFDPAKLGNDFAAILTAAGCPDTNVGMALVRDLLQQAVTYTTTAMPPQRQAYLAALQRLAHKWVAGDFETDGTPKVLAELSTAKSELTTAKNNLATMTTERDGLKTKLDAVKAKWVIVKNLLNAAIDGDKFRKGHASPNTELGELNTLLS